MSGWDADCDAEGLLCPLPVLRAARRLRALPPGATLRLTATDPASWVDVPHYCGEAGHDLLSAEDDGARLIYLIRRGADIRDG